MDLVDLRMIVIVRLTFINVQYKNPVFKSTFFSRCDFTQKNHIFSNFRGGGGARRGRPLLIPSLEEPFNI
jgi:hypothetical protein